MPAAEPNPYQSPSTVSTPAAPIDPGGEERARGDASWLGFCGACFGASAGGMCCGIGAVVGTVVSLLAQGEFDLNNAGMLLALIVACGMFATLLLGIPLGVAGFLGGIALVRRRRSEQPQITRAASVIAWAVPAAIFVVILAIRYLSASSGSPNSRPGDADYMQQLLVNIVTGPYFLVPIGIAAPFAGWRWANLMFAEAWPEEGEG